MSTFPTLPMQPSPGGAVSIEREPESKSIMVGIAATLIIHILLVFFLPRSLQNEFSAVAAIQPKAQFNLELAPELFEEAKKPDPMRFVETNPDAPENEPDKTNNFSNRNQQSAQPKPTPDSSSDRPAMEGQKEIQSTQLVDGQLVPEVRLSPAAPPPMPQVQTGEPAGAQQKQDLLAGLVKVEGENPEGLAMNLARNPVNPRPIEKPIDGVTEAVPEPGTIGINLPIVPQQPLPRPRVMTRTRPAIFEENKVGTQNIGIIGRDARWSSYGEYLNRMGDAVQLRWDNTIAESRTYPQSGSTVTVTFVINSAGEITSIKDVKSTAGEVPAGWCTSAISPAGGFSYGRWTDNMIAILGNEQELTFTFLYR